MSQHSTARSSLGRVLTGRQVLLGFLAFFGVIFAVNGFFLYAALSTHSGVVSVEPYRKGLAYNDRIAADQRQADIGWTAVLQVSENGHTELSLTDRSKIAVQGRIVTASFDRPATPQLAKTVTLVEAAPGRYSSTSAVLAPGNWVANVEVRDAAGQEPAFRMRKRLWLK